MAKRVLIFSLSYYPRFIGGAEVAIKEITDRIDPTEIKFHMLTLRYDSQLPKVEQVGNVLVHRIGFARKNPSISDLNTWPLKLNKYYFQFFAARAANVLHRKYRYDGIWAMMAHSSGIPAGMFKRAHPTVPYVLTLQEGDPPEHIEQLMKPVSGLFRQGFARADALQAISTFLAAWGTRRGFTGTPRVIPNGVDTKAFMQEFSAEEVANKKAELGKKDGLGKTDGEVYLVTTSRLVHKNGLDDVIRALAHLPEHISFLIYGIGPDEEKLRALARALQVEHRVRFMGQIAYAQIPLMLAACDIFIRPSRSEGMGNSFIEAMAAGLPVIATQEGGIADFLFDEVRNPERPATGWAVDANAPEQIAKAVEAVLADPQKAQNITQNARAMVMERYDWNTVAGDMKGLFDATLALENNVTPIRHSKEIVFAAGPETEKGGSFKYSEGLAREFRKQSNTVRVVHFPTGFAMINGIRHVVFFLKLLASLRARSVIFTFDTWSTGIPALVVARLIRKKFVVRIGGDFLWEHYIERTGNLIRLSDFYKSPEVTLSVKEKIIRFGTRVLLQQADALIFNTQWQVDLWKTAYQLSFKNAHVIENVYPKHKKNEQIRNHVFIAAGRENKLKNILALKTAFTLADTQAAGFTLDTSYCAPESHVARLSSSYAYIQASISDIAPNSVIEAASMGTPFICTEDTGIRARLEGRGLFIDTRSNESIAVAIEKLLDPTFYNALRERAAVPGFEHSWANVGRQYETLLDQIHN